MVNYQLGKIYKIVSNTDSDKCYVGSTTKKYLSSRLAHHKCVYSKYKVNEFGKFTVFDLFDEFGVDNCQIFLVESCSCNSKDELHARERFYIETMNCVNKYIPGRTDKEYTKDNKEKNIKRAKEYYLQHTEKKKEYLKEYCIQNKEKKREYDRLRRENIKNQL